jgi:hypothetical protein
MEHRRWPWAVHAPILTIYHLWGQFKHFRSVQSCPFTDSACIICDSNTTLLKCLKTTPVHQTPRDYLVLITIVFVQSKVNDTINITFKKIYFEDFSAFLLRSLFGRKKPRLPRVIVDIPRLITLRYSPMGQLKDRLT